MTATDPTSKPVASDRAEYDRLQAEMKTKVPLSPEYNALWQKSEDIKNRHQGFVPEASEAAQQKRQARKDSFTANPWDPQ